MKHLINGVRALGLSLTHEQLDSFQLYYEELVAWNQKFNLTAITEYDQVQVRHFLDSLSCLLVQALRQALGQPQTRVIDIGSGAGFPSIPLKLVFPQATITLLEATGKKVQFLEHIAKILRLREVTPVHGRAEEMAHHPAHRNAYDLALARAVAELPIVVEYALPFCKIGGLVVAQKGEAGAAEAWSAEKAISLLGGELRRVVPVELPGLPEDRSLVVIEKIGPTPERYPRRPGIPRKRPL
jgi:16S rRNA (guanine527-N7)-methyltransferase